MMIQIEALRKVYRSGSEELEIFREVHLAVPAGSTTVITGESGSGKSTLLNLIGGLDSATEGRIRFKDWDITRADETQLTTYRCRQVGFIFQFHYLLKDFTALENVRMPAVIAGSSRREAAARAEARPLLPFRAWYRVHGAPATSCCRSNSVRGIRLRLW